MPTPLLPCREQAGRILYHSPPPPSSHWYIALGKERKGKGEERRTKRARLAVANLANDNLDNAQRPRKSLSLSSISLDSQTQTDIENIDQISRLKPDHFATTVSAETSRLRSLHLSTPSLPLSFLIHLGPFGKANIPRKQRGLRGRGNRA